MPAPSTLVVVDAVHVGRGPGWGAVIRGDATEGTLSGHLSPHQVGVADLVAAARPWSTPPVVAGLIHSWRADQAKRGAPA